MRAELWIMIVAVALWATYAKFKCSRAALRIAKRPQPDMESRGRGPEAAALADEPGCTSPQDPRRLYGAMRSVSVSVWKSVWSRKRDHGLSFFVVSATLAFSPLARSSHELYRAMVRKVQLAPSRCCINTLPAVVSPGALETSPSIFSNCSR